MIKKNYEHIFFDLDHTLWDFDTNSKVVLTDIYHKFISSYNISFERFIDEFYLQNYHLWDQLEKDQISHEYLRENRFLISLNKLNIRISKVKSLEINQYFLDHLPHQKEVMPNSFELLDELKKRYKLHILSNGFELIQIKKLQYSGLMPYFSEIICQDRVGFKKPNQGIFKYALNKTGAKKERSLMVGDNLIADIQGANNAGIDVIMYHPERPNDPSINYTNNLLDLLNVWKL